MKKKRKIVIPIVIVLVVGIVAGVFAVRAANAQPQARTVDTYQATRGELMNTVDVTGMVESSSSVSVYTTLSYPVQSLAVEVGDVVREGDLLCTLDASDLQTTIRQNEAVISSAQAKANNELSLAQKDYETAVQDVKEDYNSQLLAAQQTVKARESAVKAAKLSLEQAQQNLQGARKDLRELQDDDSVYDEELAYDKAVDAAKRERASLEIALEKAQQTLADAEQDLEDARVSLRAAQKQVDDSVESAKDRITTARLGANMNDQLIALEKLRGDLAEAAVSAPVSGTITAVFAKEGASSSAGGGLLFVIENTEDLKVQTKIKEYDISAVKVGMPVVVRADGTGDAEFSGELTVIAPTALKDASGNTISTNSAEFQAEVKVVGKSDLLIGMNARLKIITEQKKDALYIPVEAITVDEDGVTEIVFVFTPAEDGTSTARKVVVETGLETDFFCEILSDGINEGDEIITDPYGLVDGMQVAKMEMDPMLMQAMTGQAG